MSFLAAKLQLCKSQLLDVQTKVRLSDSVFLCAELLLHQIKTVLGLYAWAHGKVVIRNIVCLCKIFFCIRTVLGTYAWAQGKAAISDSVCLCVKLLLHKNSAGPVCMGSC